MKAVVDRIEGDYAVVHFDDQQVKTDIPLVLLPRSIKEGDWLTVDFKTDNKATASMYQKNKELLEKLKHKNKKKST